MIRRTVNLNKKWDTAASVKNIIITILIVGTTSTTNTKNNKEYKYKLIFINSKMEKNIINIFLIALVMSKSWFKKS